MTDYPQTPELVRSLDDTGVLLLTLNRPERNNGWTYDLEDAYFGTLIAASNDPDVRAIVVTGTGKAFCPGLDMEVLASAAKGIRGGSHRRWPMTTALRVPKPMIAAVNGACAGIGFIQMVCCDIVFAAAGAKITTAFARRGLPAENGVSWILSRRIGTGRAMDLLLSGRVILSEEACQMGIVNWVVAPDELVDRAVAYARDLATNCSPASMAHIKRQVLLDWERGAEEARLQALILMSEMSVHQDFDEGVSSYREKRSPQFEGLDAALYVPKAVTQ